MQYASLIMALVGVEQETLVSEPDALTTRPPPCASISILYLSLPDFDGRCAALLTSLQSNFKLKFKNYFQVLFRDDFLQLPGLQKTTENYLKPLNSHVCMNTVYQNIC